VSAFPFEQDFEEVAPFVGTLAPELTPQFLLHFVELSPEDFQTSIGRTIARPGTIFEGFHLGSEIAENLLDSRIIARELHRDLPRAAS
jgi:hypothetical protein